MYVKTNGGMGAYRMRRGVGFALTADQPSIVRTAGQEYLTAVDTSGDYMGPTGTPGTKDLTWWLNANAGKVAIGAAAFLGLILFAKAGR